MIEEIAILCYLPLVFLFKSVVDSFEPETKVVLSKALELPWVLWCGGLSIFSAFGTYYTGKWLYNNFIANDYYTPIHGSDTEFWYYAFISSKPWEFIDTFLIVGRSKHLSQLQWFHHFATAFMVKVLKPISCDVFTWPFFLNYFVHFFMYGYFALYPYFPNIMKKFGTFVNIIQTLQMFIAIGITSYYYFNFDGKNCVWLPSDEYQKFLVSTIILMYGYYGYLFSVLFFERTQRIKKSN